MIFADIQGSCGRLSNKTMRIIIFDLMTHTEEEDSGVRDYGPQRDCEMARPARLQHILQASRLGSGGVPTMMTMTSS
ncbi:hypothetical protein B0H14DRAFT_827807 [Mycena olivaceomarginata]|nr:hypothetical protein B0H14DRAFT_827807 [Mycena olivaceomarginata]